MVKSQIDEGIKMALETNVMDVEIDEEDLVK